jgi:hypothetical protein
MFVETFQMVLVHLPPCSLLPYIVTLNNTPLEISDFGSLLEGDKLNNRIFKDTMASRNFLKDWR